MFLEGKGCSSTKGQACVIDTSGAAAPLENPLLLREERDGGREQGRTISDPANEARLRPLRSITGREHGGRQSCEASAAAAA